jgi:hypothetical protein
VVFNSLCNYIISLVRARVMNMKMLTNGMQVQF